MSNKLKSTGTNLRCILYRDTENARMAQKFLLKEKTVDSVAKVVRKPMMGRVEHRKPTLRARK